MGEEPIARFFDIQRYFARKKIEKAEEVVFKKKEEYIIVGTIIKTIFERDLRLVLYEVENFENLFDYADLFKRLHNVGPTTFFGRDVKIIAVTTYPHNFDVTDAFMVTTKDGFIPILAYFVGDFIPGSDTGSSDIKELNKVLSLVLFNKVGYAILFTTNSMILYDNIPLSRYGVKLRDIAPKVVAMIHPEKTKYAQVVGFGKLISLDTSAIESHIRSRKLPTPQTLDEISRDITFKELILPPTLKEFLRVNIINTLKRDVTSIPSILLVGPSGSGKTTLAYTIAREIGIPAYVVRVELIGSKWLGETEKIANQTMLFINDRAHVVAIFRDAELIFGERKGGSEDSMVYERVRSIIASWIRSERRRFFTVFTISNPSELPDHVLHDATFGIFKLPILPPFNKEDRKAMLSLFLRKLANKYDLVFDPLNESVNEALDVVAEETWAYTPREMMDVASIAVNITLDKGEKVINKENIQLARKYKEVDRRGRVKLIQDTINACYKVGLPESLLIDVFKFEQEAAKLMALATSEEARKRSLAMISK